MYPSVPQRPHLYNLADDGETPVPVATMSEWRGIQDRRRIIGATYLASDGAPIPKDQQWVAMISTVFLALDHNHMPSGPPVLWETMIFPTEDSQQTCDFQQRYTSRASAVAGHQCVVEAVQGHLQAGKSLATFTGIPIATD